MNPATTGLAQKKEGIDNVCTLYVQSTMSIEFDQKKAASNLKKHGVSFDDAATALLDPMALVQEDEDATDEARFLLVGMSTTGHLLTVCYTLRGELIRLISARMATKNERRQYES